VSSSRWSRPADLVAQVRRRWDSGQLLRECLDATEANAPLTLRLRKPTAADLSRDFNRVRDWITDLEAGSRAARGFGYDIHWKTVRHRVHGSNALPASVTVPSLDDAVRLIGKQGDRARFERLAAEWLAEFPELTDWLKAHPLKALEQRHEWPRLRAVLEYFRARPRPNLYLRQLEIPGVDSKFIERHRHLIGDWLDAVLPETAIDSTATGRRGFNQRYGLRDKPALVRFRILDPAGTIAGLDDLSVPAEQFARLALDAETVFITENEINGLAFPYWPGGIVIFGLGYGLERLARIAWLEQTRVIYWGDIDTHGFAILNRLRHYLPAAQALMMDRATLEQHRQLWGREPKQHRFLGQLDRLRPEENALFEDLRDDVLGERVRLEQERIDFAWVRQQLAQIAPPSAPKSIRVDANPLT
jgi:hypothetical protein